MEPVILYDTTLRDGTQGENINFSAEDKLKIAKRLDDIGIHYIEGGWPGSNPRDKRYSSKGRFESGGFTRQRHIGGHHFRQELEPACGAGAEHQPG